VLQNALHSSQRLNYIRAVVIEVPEFSVVALMGPPEGVVFDQVEGFEILPHAPAFVVSQGETVFLEKGVDSGNTVVPRLFKIIESQSSVLGLSFLSF